MDSVVPSCRRRGGATARVCLLALTLNVLVAAVTARHVAAGGVVIPHRIVHQDRGLDCEAAATEAMLSTVGNPLTQDDIQSALPLDTRPAKRSHPGNVVEQWGNPWTEFVGSVNGDQAQYTGYGVYAPPIAAVVNAKGGKVVAEQGVNPWTLYDSVASGHAAVVWVLVGLGSWGPIYWTTWDGTATIKGAPGEHAMTMVGVDPSGGTVTLMDPEAGSDTTVPMSRFEASFAVLGQQALVFDQTVAAARIVARSPWMGMASTPDGKGYWLARSDGGVEGFGDARALGQWFPAGLNKPIVGMATTPDGGGYWLVASDGGIFAFGNAGGYGSTGGIRLNRPAVGMAATPDGHGYWIVCSDGGIFPFGDAGGYGSTGNIRLNQPIVGMAAAPDGHGYWLVAADGGIFPFGPSAGGFGSTGNVRLNRPIVGMAPAAKGKGYWLVAADGGIFPFGPAALGYGSTGNVRLATPVAGMAATPDGRGYWIVVSDGGIFPFGDAPGLGSAA
jgi:uncharacterized protein YvpB